MHRLRFLAIALILLGLASSAPEAWSLNLSYTEAHERVPEFIHGHVIMVPAFRYDFTLSNDIGTDIFELFLNLPLPDSNLLSFSSPTGWGDGLGDNQPYHGPVLADTSFVEWWAELGSELGNGMSLSGFDFVSSSQVSGSIAFSVNADPSIGGVAVPVPEPATLLLVGGGLVGLIGIRRKFRK